MRHRVLLLLPLVLTACATTQEVCIDRGAARIRNLDARIAEAQGNIERGYAIFVSETPQATVGFCSGYGMGHHHYGGINTCISSDPGPREQAVAIDVAEERAKLQQLVAARASEEARYQQQVAQCRAAFPEE